MDENAHKISGKGLFLNHLMISKYTYYISMMTKYLSGIVHSIITCHENSKRKKIINDI